eukprot:5921119-Amphidinium_carterae.1
MPDASKCGVLPHSVLFHQALKYLHGIVTEDFTKFLVLQMRSRDPLTQEPPNDAPAWCVGGITLRR